jgi:Tol biopolymer transport system component
MKRSKTRIYLLILVILFALFAGLGINEYSSIFFSFLPSRYDLSYLPGVHLIPLPADLRPVFSARWSPSGDKIAIVTEKHGGLSGIPELYIFELTTKEIKRITISGNTFVAGTIDWSPDGSLIAASGEPYDQSSGHGIWIIDIKGSKFRYLTRGIASTWSPSGNQLAVLDISKSHPLMKIVDLNTGEEQIFHEYTQDASLNERQIEWSPDGDNIVLTITKNDSEGYRFDRLYLLSSDGSSFKPLFANPEWSMNSPSWFSDGKWLVFVTKTSQGDTVSVAPATGECVIAWLPSEIQANTVDVSPDGRKVVFTYFGRVYISDIQNAVGSDALPGVLHCP